MLNAHYAFILRLMTNWGNWKGTIGDLVKRKKPVPSELRRTCPTSLTPASFDHLRSLVESRKADGDIPRTATQNQWPSSTSVALIAQCLVQSKKRGGVGARVADHLVSQTVLQREVQKRTESATSVSISPPRASCQERGGCHRC